MVRTLVSIEENDKRWLDSYSQKHGYSTAETIRKAIKDFQMRMREADRKAIFDKMFGILKDKEDAVKFVRKIREEWD